MFNFILILWPLFFNILSKSVLYLIKFFSVEQMKINSSFYKYIFEIKKVLLILIKNLSKYSKSKNSASNISKKDLIIKQVFIDMTWIQITVIETNINILS